MRQILFIFLVALFSVSCGSGSQEMLDALNQVQDINLDSLNSSTTANDNDTSALDFSSPVRYNDFIINNQTEIYNKIVDLVNCMEKCDDKELRQKYNDFGDQVKYSIKEIKRLKDYNGNTEFRDKAIDLFNFYLEIYEKQYKELIEMVIKGNPSKKDETRMNEIVAEVSEKEAKLDAAFQAAQQKFAQDNDMEIVPNEIQEKIDNM